MDSQTRATHERHDPYAALRIRDYRYFGAGFLVGSTGLQLMNTLVMWEVWVRTEDVLQSGLVGLSRALPVVLLALVGGHAADVFDRRSILLRTQAGFGVVALVFALLSWMQAPVWWYFVLLAFSGCIRAFNGPARGSFLPLIVPAGIFQNAVTYQSGVFQAAAIGGPLLAGALIEWLTPGKQLWVIYLLAAVGCFIFSATVGCTRPRATVRAQGGLTPRAMLQGMEHMWRERPVFGAILLDLLAVLFGGAAALLPVYATDVLQCGEKAPMVLGWLKAAPYLGALAMAVWLMYRPAFQRTGPVLLWSVAVYAVAMIIFGLSGHVWLSLLALAVGGAADNVSVVIRHVLVQMRTPDHLRGRVGAINSMFIECSNEVGQFESGAVAYAAGRLLHNAVAGVVFSVVSGGVGTLAAVGGVAWKLPALRKLGRVEALQEPEQEP